MPKSTFYSRLFRYRSGEARAPLEDFLTEALADIFARLPITSLVAVIEAMTGAPGDWEDALMSSRVQFVTQVACDGGFADLVMRLDDAPALVVENKLYSSVRQHGDADDPRNQLMTYGRWLERQRDQRLPAALVLLTHATPPPEGFDDGEGYGVASRATYTWAHLARRLRSLADPATTSGTLSIELVAFLEENGMTNDTVTGADIAAARIFLPSWGRWGNTLSLLWEAVGDLREGLLSRKVSDLKVDVEGGLLWSWCYGAAPLPHSSWLAFGVRFPDLSEWYSGIGLPEHPHLLLIVGSDNGLLPVERVQAVPEGWLRPEGELITWLPLHDLPADPDAAAVGMSAWARARFSEARQMLDAMRD